MTSNSEKEFQEDVRLIANQAGGSYCEMLIMKHKIVIEAVRTHYDKEIKILRDALEQCEAGLEMLNNYALLGTCKEALAQLKTSSQNSTESTDAGAERKLDVK